MKKLQMLAASVALTLLLSASTFADDGIIQCGLTSPPPPPPAASSTTSATADEGGIIQNGAPAGADTVAEVTAALLQGVLALF